ncbi:MAG: nucleotidyltransferase domain-containing protein [Patescibacteria group bacterium]
MYIGPFYFDTKEIFGKYPDVKLVYLFGSQAEGKASPMSDYDFAVYFDEKTPSLRRSDIKIKLIVDLMKKLKNNNIDVVVMNDKLDPLLKYEIISKRKVIYEKEPYRILIEPIILSQYFDFYTFKDRKII